MRINDLCSAGSVPFRRLALPIASLLLAAMLGLVDLPLGAEEPMAEPIRTIEGITEYRLDNGAQVLLFPDRSKSMVTVNMTVFVGSRHEGYGEAGMAHLLEHMLFKGTPGHPDIPEELKNRGAEFNGTTWLDRTNYYETLPASNPEQASDNLEFALQMEADRLVNSHISGEDLASEMTVVRSEFERGENNPRRILMQRVQSAAYDWHNYGRSTIGNQSDIERVPVDRLRDFYRKYYRADNILLIVAGNFDEQEALSYIEEHFGALERPDVPLDRTYTTEPPQDGERTVVLRRVGNTQYVNVAYHVPSGANREYAAIELLAYIFGNEPSGRLYQQLIVPEIASNTSAMSLALHDPGLIMFFAQVSTEKSIEKARQKLLQTVEGVAEEPITEKEAERARSQFLKERELRASDSKGLAIELSEWAAQGDWRLYFLFRDYVEEVTAEECTTAAEKYLTRNNRTVGLFIPSEESQRVSVPAKPDLDKLLADYQGREAVEQGEAFDPDPVAIEERTSRGELSTGIKTVLLPKRTRGSTVNLEINLRYGNQESLLPYVAAIDFLPELLMRGTQRLSHAELRDRLDELRSQVRLSGTTGLLSASIETKREYLPELLPLVSEILRQPRFDPDELEILRRQAISSTEARMTEPTVLAGLAVRRELAPYPKDDIRYVPDLEERIERFRQVTIDDLKKLHAEQLSGQNGEVTVVGAFDPDEIREMLEDMFAGWTTEIEHQRVPQPAHVDVPGKTEEIITPDKANAVYYAGMQMAISDEAEVYPALVIGNYILGGASLSSRLGDRVRQQEGLSYSVGSGINAHPIDERANLTLYAITNPENREKLIEVIDEEINKLLDEGITEEELRQAQAGYLQSEQLNRTQDDSLARILASTAFAQRDMRYYAQFEQAIDSLTTDQVHQALRELVDPERLVIYLAGDFSKEKAEASN